MEFKVKILEVEIGSRLERVDSRDPRIRNTRPNANFSVKGQSEITLHIVPEFIDRAAKIMGDIMFGATVGGEPKRLLGVKKLVVVNGDRPIVTINSTHPRIDELLVLADIIEAKPDTLRICVPRDDQWAAWLGTLIYNHYEIPSEESAEPGAASSTPAAPPDDDASPIEGLKKDQVDYLTRRCEELEPSARVANGLQNAGCEYIFQVVEKTEAEMLKTKNFGDKSIRELKEILAELGLQLGMNFRPEQLASLKILVKARRP